MLRVSSPGQLFRGRAWAEDQATMADHCSEKLFIWDVAEPLLT
jgi:hypothetical protein